MDHNDLVELVLARVIEKLAEKAACEGPCSARNGDGLKDDRPGLLVLTQGHGEDCHSVLEDPCLQPRYRTECAPLRDYQVDLDEFEVVVIYGFTNDVLCRLASGVCDTAFTRLAQQALLSGKRVFVPAEEVEAMNASCSLPAPYCAMLREKLAMLTACGLTVCARRDLAEAVLNGCCCAAKPAAPPAAPAAAVPEKELCLNKRVITERDVTAADGQKATCIHIGEKSILTALAAEYAKSKGIRLVRDADC